MLPAATSATERERGTHPLSLSRCITSPGSKTNIQNQTSREIEGQVHSFRDFINRDIERDRSIHSVTFVTIIDFQNIGGVVIDSARRLHFYHLSFWSGFVEEKL